MLIDGTKNFSPTSNIHGASHSSQSSNETQANDKEKPPDLNPTRQTTRRFQKAIIMDPKLSEIISSLSNDDEKLISESLKSLNQFSQTDSSGIAFSLDFQRIIQILLNSQNETIIENALSLLQNLSKTTTIPKLIDIISPLFGSKNEKIQISTVNVILNSIGKLYTENQTKLTMQFLCSKIDKLPSKLRNLCIQTLTKMAQNKENAAKIIQFFDFAKALNLSSPNPSYYSYLIQLILTLLPKCPYLESIGYPQHQRPSNSSEFAESIQPHLIQFLMNNPILPLLTLLAISSSFHVHFKELNDIEISIFLSYSSDPDIAPFVLSLFSFYLQKTQNEQKKKNIIIDTLGKVEVKPERVKWYTRELRNLRDSYFAELPELTHEEIIEKLKANEITPFEFIYSPIIEHIHTLIENDEIKENDDDLILIISQLAVNSLNYCPLSPNHGPLSPKAFLSLLKSDGMLTIVLPTNQQLKVKAPYQSSLSLVEGLINEGINNYDSERIKFELSQNPEIQHSLSLAYPVQASQLSLIFRAIDPNYMSLKLSNGQKQYSIHESMLSIFCDNESPPVLKCLPNDQHDNKSSLPQLKELKLGFFSTLFSLLTLLSLKFTGLSLHCESFIKRVHKSLSYPLNSIGRRSSNLTLLFKYPFLFPEKLRMFAFKLISADPLLALKILIHEYYDQKDFLEILPKQSPLKIHVSRGRIFEDGLKYLEMFGQNKIPIEIQFKNEPGSGPGPTKYFFNILQEKFKRHEMFRYDKSQGLFPAPNADPKMFELFGMFIAKALSMDIPLNLNLNPAFIEKLKGNEISIEDVDRILGHSLQQDLIGNEFLYPGYEDIQLISKEDSNQENFSQTEEEIILNPKSCQTESNSQTEEAIIHNQEEMNQSEQNSQSEDEDSIQEMNAQTFIITPENIDKYRNLIIETTIGSHVNDCCIAFLKGFDSVIPFESFKQLFSSQEISNLLFNDTQTFSYQELEKHVHLEGFTKNDAQIQALFTLLSEMEIRDVKSFLRFVTGLDFTPNGGLKEFQPPLTIQRTDISKHSLPTAKTCSNQLNLPVYSSLEEQSNKLKEAISYCHLFLLG